MSHIKTSVKVNENMLFICELQAVRILIFIWNARNSNHQIFLSSDHLTTTLQTKNTGLEVVTEGSKAVREGCVYDRPI